MSNRSKTTVFRQLLINIMLPLFATMLILAYLNYARNRELLLEAHQEKNERIQEDIKKVLAFQDVSLESVEADLDKYLRTMSDILVNEFFANTDSIEELSLEEIRHNLGMKQDIYIINREGIIVNTTFIRDLGFNLFSIDEKHKEFLLDIFKNGKFVSEKLSLERSTKRLKKYTYQPTLDGKYIIEIGAYSQEASEIVDYYREHLEDLSDIGSEVVSVDLFLGRDDPVSLTREAELDPDHKDLYVEAFDSKSDRSVSIEQG